MDIQLNALFDCLKTYNDSPDHAGIRSSSWIRNVYLRNQPAMSPEEVGQTKFDFYCNTYASKFIDLLATGQRLVDTEQLVRDYGRPYLYHNVPDSQNPGTVLLRHPPHDPEGGDNQHAVLHSLMTAPGVIVQVPMPDPNVDRFSFAPHLLVKIVRLDQSYNPRGIPPYAHLDGRSELYMERTQFGAPAPTTYVKYESETVLKRTWNPASRQYEIVYKSGDQNIRFDISDEAAESIILFVGNPALNQVATMKNKDRPYVLAVRRSGRLGVLHVLPYKYPVCTRGEGHDPDGMPFMYAIDSLGRERDIRRYAQPPVEPHYVLPQLYDALHFHPAA